jgi:hypothetical protein
MQKEIAILYVFTSESSPGKQYQTLVYVDGSTSCECPGWKFKKRITATGERTCKHVRYHEAGMADSHAIKSVRYAEIVSSPARARLPRLAVPGTMARGNLSAQAAGRRRIFDLSED